MNIKDLEKQLSKEMFKIRVEDDMTMGYLYFLSNQGEIVYVGQSVNPEQRVRQHTLEGRIAFDEAHAYPTHQAKLEEMLIVSTINPTFNQNTCAL